MRGLKKSISLVTAAALFLTNTRIQAEAGLPKCRRLEKQRMQTSVSN